MPKGNPNSDNRSNFVVKIRDGNDYKPIYQPPEATSKIRGITYLSDAVDGTDDAETGVTSATPLAVKKANDNANTKLSRTDTTAQTVAGAVTFSSSVTVGNGITGNLKGNVTGNADTATKLKTPRTVTVKVGDASGYSATFDGSADATINIAQVDASTVTKGTLPLSVIPASAQERVVTVADRTARLALTGDQVQVGDTVYQTDTNTMYMVKDDTALGKDAGYQEYSAGTASRLGTVDLGSSDQGFYLAEGVPTAMSSTIGGEGSPVYVNSGHTTAMTATIGASNRGTYMVNGVITPNSHTVDADVPASAVFTDMVGSTSSTAGSRGLVPAPPRATENLFLSNQGTWLEAGKVKGVKGNAETEYRTGEVNITPANVGALALTGGTISGNVVPNADVTVALGSNTSRWSNVYSRTFTGALVGNADTATTATTAGKVSNDMALTGDVTTNIISLNTTSPIRMGTTISEQAVTLKKLNDEVGTVMVSETEPTDEHVKIWVQA